MKWKVIEESITTIAPVVANRRDKLPMKIGLSNLLEFLYQFSYEEPSNSNNSYSFQSVISSNVDR